MRGNMLRFLQRHILQNTTKYKLQLKKILQYLKIPQLNNQWKNKKVKLHKIRGPYVHKYLF